MEKIAETGISPEAVAKKAAEIKDTESKVEDVAEDVLDVLTVVGMKYYVKGKR